MYVINTRENPFNWQERLRTPDPEEAVAEFQKHYALHRTVEVLYVIPFKNEVEDITKRVQQVAEEGFFGEYDIECWAAQA